MKQQQQHQQSHNEREPHQAQVHLILMSSMFYGARVAQLFVVVAAVAEYLHSSPSRDARISCQFICGKPFGDIPKDFEHLNLSGITMSMNMWASRSISQHWMRIDLWIAGSFVCENGIKSSISNLGVCSQQRGEIKVFLLFLVFLGGHCGSITSGAFRIGMSTNWNPEDWIFPSVFQLLPVTSDCDSRF